MIFQQCVPRARAGNGLRSKVFTMFARYPLTSEVVMKKIEDFNVLLPLPLQFSCDDRIVSYLNAYSVMIALVFNLFSCISLPFRRLCSSATCVLTSTKSRPLSRSCTASTPSA